MLFYVYQYLNLTNHLLYDRQYLKSLLNFLLRQLKSNFVMKQIQFVKIDLKYLLVRCTHFKQMKYIFKQDYLFHFFIFLDGNF